MMVFFLSLLLLFSVSLALAFFNTPRWIWFPVVTALLVTFSFVQWTFAFVGLLIFVVMLFFMLTPVRRYALSKPLLARMRRKVRPISRTERIVLEAGNTWIEKDLFQGKPDWLSLATLPIPELTLEQQAFLDNETEQLCKKLSDWQICYEKKALPDEVWTFIKAKGFLGMAIPTAYGGKHFPAMVQSAVVSKIASRSTSAAISIMVPNSLGPGELLTHYGTDAQKAFYLPRLASGEDVPCFALTATEAGSDASSIPDYGIVCPMQHEGKQVLGIRLTWDKRYITLAPIATLMGIAFQLYDPQHLLGEQEDIGITVALIPTDHPGVVIGKRHYPMMMGFMNGPTQGKDVMIPLDWVIGGQEKVGQGWQMLMECLSIGRSISLPSVSNGIAQLCLRMTTAYAQCRQQFKVPIVEFDGVKRQLASVAGYTYLLDAVRVVTASALSAEIKPATVSAIAKYHLTEMCRVVVNRAMDIHAGRAVQAGPSNYLLSPYLMLPVMITVEGANILTRNLMIFGQGVLRCHPFVAQEIDALEKNDVALFDKFLFQHMGYSLHTLARCFVMAWSGGYAAHLPKTLAFRQYYRQLTRMSAALAMVSDMSLLLLGDSLKRRERLSARLGDVLSYLYIATALLRYYRLHADPQALPLLHWGMQTCLFNMQRAFDKLLRNFPKPGLARWLNLLVFPFGKRWRQPSDALDDQVVDRVLADNGLRHQLSEASYVSRDENDVTGKVEVALDYWLRYRETEAAFYRIMAAHDMPAHMPFLQKIEMALEKSFIDEKQANQLRVLHKQRSKAIDVDVFDSSL